LFTFKCRIGLAEGFPVILRTIVQTFLIEVRLLILDTKDYSDGAAGRYVSCFSWLACHVRTLHYGLLNYPWIIS